MDYQEYRVAELKTKLHDRNLPVSGTKNKLIERLINDDLKREEENGIITVTVKTLMGSYHTVKLKKTDTVLDLKEAIQDRLGVEPEQMRLWYLTFNVELKLGDTIYPDGSIGVRLGDDSATMQELGIQNDSFLDVRISL